MARTSRPRGLLFDLCGTLLRESRWDQAGGNIRQLERMAGGRPLDAAGLRRTFGALEEESVRRKMESQIEFPALAYLRLLAAHAGLGDRQFGPEDEWAFYLDSTTTAAEPGAVEMLRRVRALGLPVGVVSNHRFSGAVLARDAARHGLAVHVDFLMSSADYGYRKPHRDLMVAAAVRLGVDPRAVWFAGDNPAMDLAGAAAAGMTGVWYNPAGASHDGAPAAIEVKDWEEFTALLE